MSNNDDYSYTAILSNAGSASSGKNSDDSWKAKKSSDDSQKATKKFAENISQQSTVQSEDPVSAPPRKVRF